VKKMDPYQSKTDEEIRQLAMDAVEGKIFFGSMIREADIDCVFTIFMPIILGGTDLSDWMKDNKVIELYEYLSEAGPRAINGYPTFFSVKFLDEADAERFRALAREFREVTQKLLHPPKRPPAESAGGIDQEKLFDV